MSIRSRNFSQLSFARIVKLLAAGGDEPMSHTDFSMPKGDTFDTIE